MGKNRLMTLVILGAALACLSASAGPGIWDDMENVYYGDLHVHTAYSVDAFVAGTTPGRYVDEAGMYAMYCSKVDFYSCTDHAEMLSDSNYWEETIKSAQHFNQLGAENPDANGDPSIVVFPGWEWTLSAVYGHKNVILKYDDPAKLPPSPIRCLEGIVEFPAWSRNIEVVHNDDTILTHERILTVLASAQAVAKGNDDTDFLAPESGDLFRLLREHCTQNGTGCEAQVIPHGNAWGVAPVMYTSWKVQLDPVNHDPDTQRVIETISKHGNSEEYSYFPPNWHYYKNGREATEDECMVVVKSGIMDKVAQMAAGADLPTEMIPECTRECGEPNDSYQPCCHRAGEIVAERCVDPSSDWCQEQIELARQLIEPFPKHVLPHERKNLKPEYRLHPNEVEPLEWKACGQCLDCWKPAFNYRNNGSVQKALASAYFDDAGTPLHYRFGFIGSTDTHSAWPASVKEDKRQGEIAAGTVAGLFDIVSDDVYEYPGWERGDNFFDPGGLAVILAESRTRDSLWENFLARNVYSTSGARIEVWARAQIGETVVRMGSETTASTNPTFHLKANGALVEDDTCPYDDEPLISSHMSRDEFQRVCDNQCYRTTDERTAIDRIEVVKVLQPMTPAEADMANLERSPENPAGLIMDPYHVEQLDGTQIEWSWTDPQFVEEPAGRSVAYYFRVIQKPTPGYNCRPIALIDSGRSCYSGEPNNDELAAAVNPQDGSAPQSLLEIDDLCYSTPDEPESFCQERAWTSPFYMIKE